MYLSIIQGAVYGHVHVFSTFQHVVWLSLTNCKHRQCNTHALHSITNAYWNVQSLDYLLIYPNPQLSATTFYYEYHYNLQDGGFLVALWAVLTSCYLLLFSVEECLSVQ